MEITLTGRITVRIDGDVTSEAALGPLGRLAFAYLVLERQRPVTRDELAHALWGAEDVPATWRAALRGVVSRLRAFLSASEVGSIRILTNDNGCYQLCLPIDTIVDVETAAAAFEAARAALNCGETQKARQAAGSAADVCRRQFLPGGTGVWVERRQAELRELHVQSLEVLSQAAGACGDHAAALRAAEEAVALQGLRESAHLRVIEAHTHAGNRGEALRAYERCRQLLAAELGVRPSPQTESAYLELLGEEPQPRSPGDRQHVSNLPASVTTFVGEDRIEEVKVLLSTTRLLTLTGTGGAGKSRLAIEVAATLAPDYADGVWLVELAGLTNPAHVPQRVLSVLEMAETPGCHPLESLVRHLAARELLVVFDNCEHVVSACAAVADELLRAAPGLRILATSREPLRTPGEMIWAVPLLSTPPAAHVGSLDALLQYEAVRLFVDRCASAAPGLDLDVVCPAVVAICRRLDGVPLAIELAAAQARALGIPEIARRLDDRLRLLRGGPRTAPPRHQTLRGALDWSYESLSPSQQKLFTHLSVFAGGFTLEAAEAVCPDGADLLGTLVDLVDKSLVLCDRSGGEARYRLLETLRQYGAERLSPQGEQVALRNRHLRWAAGLVERAEVGLEGRDQRPWLDVLDMEHDNLRAGLDWAEASGANCVGLQLAASLWRFWEIRGYLSEGRSRLQALLASSDECGEALRAKALNSAGVLAQRQSDRPAARRYFDDCVAIRRAQGDHLGTASACHGLGTLAVGERDFATARVLFQHNLEIGREMGEPRMIAASLMNLGVVVQFLAGRDLRDSVQAIEEATCCYQESLALYRELGDAHGEAMALESLAALVSLRGHHEASRSLLRESLSIRRKLGDRIGVAASLRFLGHLAVRAGDYLVASQLHEESLTIERELGNDLQVAADLASLADIAEREGDVPAARRLMEESVALSGAGGP